MLLFNGIFKSGNWGVIGTPRSEIPSHYPMVSHSPCDLSDLNTNSRMKLPSNTTTNTLLTSFGVVHTSLQLNKSP